MQITREELEDLFIIQNLTRKQIADKLGVKERYIKAKLAQYNIKKGKELLRAHYTGGHTAGMHWWHKGNEHTCAKDCPGEGWILGKSQNFKDKAKERSKIRKFSSEGLEKIKENGRKRKGCNLSEEHKQKIRQYWKEHDHPNKGKPRSEIVKEKISKKLMGVITFSPTRDIIQSLTKEQMNDLLLNGEYLDFNIICNFLGIHENSHNRKSIIAWYKENNVKFKIQVSTSVFEKEVLAYIKSIYTGDIIENDRKILKPLEVDICIPDKKVLIECNGVYWHRIIYKKVGDKIVYDNERNMKNINYHYNKSKLAYEQGYRMIHIWEDQWLDNRLRPILEAIIRSALGVDVYDEKIYARNCELKEINSNLYKDFCNKYHTQLSRPAKVKLGLFYKGELVQVASFSKFKISNRANKDKNNDYDWEFIRGCEAFNHARVIGGVSKLFSYFVKKYNPKNVLCYSDFNFFNGKGYIKSGFELTGFTGADKFYIDVENMKRIPRRSNKYHEYMEKVVAGKYYCCYGAGSLRFLWQNNKQDL